jgi:hypothetical protein
MTEQELEKKLKAHKTAKTVLYVLGSIAMAFSIGQPVGFALIFTILCISRSIYLEVWIEIMTQELENRRNHGNTPS